jgi:nitroimidazol reductase NimA-like FMN-containing flavoprotein (pyridoxamine 5'-phosphate oxidase superfamily)
MQPMSHDRVTELLAGPHQAILSVARLDKGPLAVPISYHFDGSSFFMVTDPRSLHGRLMERRGRATITIQFERCDGPTVCQWYVTAEGRVRFTEDDPAPHVRTILAKDRGDRYVDRWTSEPPPPTVKVAVLTPERIGGYEFRDALPDA